MEYCIKFYAEYLIINSNFGNKIYGGEQKTSAMEGDRLYFII